MIHRIRFSAQWTLPVVTGVCLLALFVFVQPALAIIKIPSPDPKPGSYGLEATKLQPAPTQGATITTPGNGASFTNSPITVTGICPNDLLVQLYNNSVMVGSVVCKGGSFSLQVSLFSGTNELSATVYDDLDQTGPASNVVTVNYTNTNFTAFGSLITLTSSYGRRSAPAGNELGWPLQLSGGNGPYAFNIDWGDGSKPELKSQSLMGVVTIAHTYKNAGIYQLNVTVTDVNGVTAFLQLVAVSSGQVVAGSGTSGASSDAASKAAATPKVLWVPAAISFVLLLPTFWLGRLSQVVSLRNKMLRDRDSYEEK